MPIRKDKPGVRSVEIPVELSGTPEQVWKAIATGPGISSWFVPTEVEEREGGVIKFHLGPGMDSVGTVTEWKPPFKFAYEERDWAPNAPPLATELTIEARSGGTCVLRLVHSLFASGDEWNDQLEGFESGWEVFFLILQLAFTFFRGQPCTNVFVLGESALAESKVWELMSASLGLKKAKKGDRRAAPSGVPPFDGVVERVSDGRPHHEVLLRTEKPAPGLVSLGAFTWGGKVHVAIRLYYYGDDFADAAAWSESRWRAWMKQTFPPTNGSNNVT
jgi:uncharacterized protein YndB with AHSA1/START domain